MSSAFKFVNVEMETGIKHLFGRGGIPVSDALEKALLAAIPAPPPPPVPALRRIIAPDKEQRGTGVRNKSLTDTEVCGFEQNIVIVSPGSFLLKNVRTRNAWRSSPEDANEGQGLYLGGQSGQEVKISGFYAARNGWQEGRGIKSKNDRRHGIYANEGGTLEIEDFILSENASVGMQYRRLLKGARRGFVHRNSIGILALMQPGELEDIVIYGGSWGVPAGQSNWVGMVGLDLYAPVKAKNVWIVGAANTPLPSGLPDAKRYDGGAVKCSRSHGQYPNTPGGSIEASGDCVIAGWPTETGSGDLFSGDKAHDGSGFRLVSQPVDVDEEVCLILADLEANRLPSIKGACQRLRDLVRGAVR